MVMIDFLMGSLDLFFMNKYKDIADNGLNLNISDLNKIII